MTALKQVKTKVIQKQKVRNLAALEYEREQV